MVEKRASLLRNTKWFATWSTVFLQLEGCDSCAEVPSDGVCRQPGSLMTLSSVGPKPTKKLQE